MEQEHLLAKTKQSSVVTTKIEELRAGFAPDLAPLLTAPALRRGRRPKNVWFLSPAPTNERGSMVATSGTIDPRSLVGLLPAKGSPRAKLALHKTNFRVILIADTGLY